MSVVPKEEGELRGTVLRIPIKDWVEKYVEEEPDLSSLERAFQVGKKVPPATMGVLCLIGGLRGEAAEEVAILPKTTLLVGASAVVSRRIAQQMEEFEAPSGRVYCVRRFVADVAEQESDDDDEMAMEIEVVSSDGGGYVEVGSTEALRRAESYLLNRIPGYIFGRLKVMAVSGGDVGAVADLLKAKVDDLVDRLCEPKAE